MAQSLVVPAPVASASLSTTHALPRPPLSQVLWRLVVVQAIAWFFASVWLLDRVGLRWLWYVVTLRRARYEAVTLPVALRLAFERLGPTYVKLGQLVASGEALFPPRYSAEFHRVLHFSLSGTRRSHKE